MLLNVFHVADVGSVAEYANHGLRVTFHDEHEVNVRGRNNSASRASVVKGLGFPVAVLLYRRYATSIPCDRSRNLGRTFAR